MPAYPAVIRGCIDLAVDRAALLVDNAVVQASEALEQDIRRRESAGERQALTHALRALLQERLTWRARYGAVLRNAIDHPPPRRGEGLVLNPSSLTLVDDSAITDSIETSRLTQQLAARVEQPLADFDGLMSSALGLDGVQPEHNPLRPEVFAQALRTLMAEGEPQAEWPGFWMRGMAQSMGSDLGQLYVDCRKLLADARVRAAGYRVITSPAPLEMARGESRAADSRPAGLNGPQTQSGAGSHSGPAALGRAGSSIAQAISSWVALAGQALRGPVVRDFLLRDSPQARERLAPSWYDRLDEELVSLHAADDEPPRDATQDQAVAALPVVDRPQRAVGTDSPLAAGWGAYTAPRQRALVRTALKKQAEVVGQAMGVELVRQLLDQVAQDPRLLAPMREAMVALEPALGRLALAQPRFFGEPTNPARQLLEQVAARSLRYNDEFSSEFQAFFSEVRAGFSALNGLQRLADATPFQQVGQRLQARWQAQDRQEEEQRAQLLQAVQAAERRQAEAEQVAWELSHRSDLAGVPAVVQEFLYNRWAMVLAHARQNARPGELDPGGYLAVIGELLWSVNKDQALRDPARAFELIPRVVVKLRAGLATIGEQPADTDTFFAALEHLHRPVMKLRARHRRQSLEGGAAPPPDIDLSPAQTQVPQAREELWLAPGEQRACGFEDTVPAPDEGSGTEAQAPHATRGSAARPPLPPLAESDADALLASLREGAWVDLYSRQRWRRAQLTWASTKGTLFMFVSHGGRPHSMTRRSLQRLLCERLVRPVATHEVVQHAIDQLALPAEAALAPA